MVLPCYLNEKIKQNQPLNNKEDKQQKYESFILIWHRDLYRYAYWLTKDKSTAEDLVQETYLRAWRSLEALQETQAAKAWLFTILRRENARRFERKHVELVELNEQEIAEQHRHTIEQINERDWLHQQILRLSPEYHEPLVLQVVAGFTGDEIAALLSLNQNTVMTRLFRARMQLKQLLQPLSAQEIEHEQK